MRQQNQFLFTSLLLSIASFPGSSHALDLTFEPRLQAGVIDYKFERKGGTVTTDDSITGKDSGDTTVDTLPFVGVGTTVFANRLFFDIYLQKAFSGADTLTRRLDWPSHEEDQLAFPTETFILDSDFEREEYSISVGYVLGSNWALFGGYRTAKLSFTDITTQDDEITDPNGNIFKKKGHGKTNSSFKQKGFFFGSAYAFNINEHAIFTLTAALAALNGKNSTRGAIDFVTDINGDITTETVDQSGNSDGDTVGLNLGASWKGRIVENLSYSLDMNGYNYDFNSSNSEDSDFSETVLRFSAGLSYRF